MRTQSRNISYLREFHSDQLESFLLESFDNIGNKTPVDSIRLNHEKCSLFVSGVRGHPEKSGRFLVAALLGFTVIQEATL